MRLLAFAAVLAFTVNATPFNAQMSPVLGDWREPTGSIIRIERCPSGICLRLINLSPSAPVSTDIHNPDPTRRHRALCGLEIGRQFHFTDPTHLSGGTLYDPKSGNTYRGAMAVEGDILKLRGYVGMPLFGKTEAWRRVMVKVPSCIDTGTH
jgi:uncharacterized protein (DUF2147 family)